jgi:hypothetical protein
MCLDGICSPRISVKGLSELLINLFGNFWSPLISVWRR